MDKKTVSSDEKNLNCFVSELYYIIIMANYSVFTVKDLYSKYLKHCFDKNITGVCFEDYLDLIKFSNHKRADVYNKCQPSIREEKMRERLRKKLEERKKNKVV